MNIIPFLQASLLLAATLVAPSWLQAGNDLVPRRTASTLAAPQLTSAPQIDGDLSDVAWKQAQPLRDFAFGKGVRFQTEGWVARDASNLYFAARCYDDNLKALVTASEGMALWKNDCIELFIVPRKEELFTGHFVVSCEGKVAFKAWAKDEWGEPTAGRRLPIACVAGREKDAWTVEVAIPLAIFGDNLDLGQPWALGFNREKQNKPSEVSSFQGSFNTPTEYPDLAFDGRSVLVDGLGLRSIGSVPQKVQVTIQSRNEGAALGKPLTLTLPAGERVALPWQAQTAGLKAGDAFTVRTADSGGKLLVTEEYKLVEPTRPPPVIDPASVPPPHFVKTVLDDPNFFPISVWLQPACTIEMFKAIGVNTFVGGCSSYPTPRGKEFFDMLRAQGLVGLAEFTPENLAARLQDHPAFIGWMEGDEPDLSNPATGQAVRTPEEVLAIFKEARTVDPGHRFYVNLSQAVGQETFVGSAATPEQLPIYAKYCDIISFDVYPCNSVQPNGPDRMHLVAKGIDRARRWSVPGTPVWTWIEVNQIQGLGRAPTPDEVKTQIWMALVHGATGYGFFCHSWSAAFFKEHMGIESGYSQTAISKTMIAALTTINAEVKALAAVLNSPTLADGTKVTVSQGSRVDAITKAKDGAIYVFAVNMYRKPEAATLTVKGSADGIAEVLYENRTVEVKKGVIVDTFAPYAVHRYKLAAAGLK